MSSLDQSPNQSSIASSGEVAKLINALPSAGRSELRKASNILLVLMAATSAILVPSRMLFSSGAPNDSSIFAYIGWAMNHGLMPYRDLWDHKGPLLYYLQFAGVYLHPASTFGIGLLELLAFAFAFFLLYRVIGSFASYRVSLGIAVLSLVFVAHFSEGGNLCESWALLPLAAAHYLAWRWSQRTSLQWCAPLLGVCFASIFWLRPNMVVFPSVAMLAMLYVSKKEDGIRTSSRLFIFAVAAALGLTGLVLAPIYRTGAFPDFIGAYFGYNAAYSASLSVSVRLLHTRQLIIQLFAAGLAVLGTAGWALALKARASERTKIAGIPPVYFNILIWSLPLEVAAACLSGRDYSHYVLPLFPSLAVLAAWFLTEIENSAKERGAGSVLALILVLGFFPVSLAVYAADFSDSSAPPRDDYLQVIRFIQHTTNPNDKIIVIGGAEAGYIAYRAQRLPASRYVYQYPLIDAANPAASEQRRQFMCDLVANRPAVIISGNPLLGVLCSSQLNCGSQNGNAPLSDYGYNSTVLPKLLKTFLASEYRPFDAPGFEGIHAFVRRDIVVPASW